MKPVKTFGDYVVCFSAEEEEMSARDHFINECGWTQKEFARIRNYAWFCARVSVWKGDAEIAIEYLGACSYRTVDEFYKKYEGDYFADMVTDCANTIGDPDLLARVNEWCEKLRA